MSSGTDYRRALVASQFHRARRQAAIESLLSRFSGRPVDLLSFDEVVGKLGISGQSSLGVQQIPIDAIVGSVGRYQDFTRTFLPRRESDENRWVTVGAVARSVADLPPIDVYKVGESYFVLDGNHRVSLARQQELKFIDAAIIEVRTRVPLPLGATPDDLIIAAEYAAFLAYTRLDILRPDADLQVSVPGQYRHMENHIEAYRFLLETSEDREVGYEMAFEEAAGRWYDDAYLPLVQVIREQGVLRYFPGRTETDFFIWLARHRAELQNELGWTISPDVTVTRLSSKVKADGPKQPTLAARLRRLTRLVPPEPVPPLNRSWAEERTLGRYSDHLFANVLYPIAIREDTGEMGPTPGALHHALTLAAEERARFCALCLFDHPTRTAGELAAVDALRKEITGRDDSARLLVETGDPTRRTLELAFLHDLIVVERSFNPLSPGEPAPTAAVRAIVAAANRPVFIVGEGVDSSLFKRVLLVHDTRRRFDEALFIAAYLAEMCKVDLSVLPLSNGRNTEEVVARVDNYLQLHEVNATFLDAVRPSDAATDLIIDAAQTGDCDLILLSGPAQVHTGGRSNQPTDLIGSILQRRQQSILIAT